MGDVVGQVLPLAVGVAISPIPIIAVILMLLAPRARGTSLGFMIGWVAGIVTATVVFLLVAGVTDLDTSEQPSAAASWIRLGLGAVLLLLGARQWRRQPEPGQAAPQPAWMSAIDSFTTVKALGLGAALAAVNPKNLILCVAAGVTIGAAGLTAGGQAVAVAVYTLIAACTVVLPVVAYLAAADRMREPLDRLRQWLQLHNSAVMAALLTVLGAVLVGKGVGGL